MCMCPPTYLLLHALSKTENGGCCVHFFTYTRTATVTHCNHQPPIKTGHPRALPPHAGPPHTVAPRHRSRGDCDADAGGTSVERRGMFVCVLCVMC